MTKDFLLEWLFPIKRLRLLWQVEPRGINYIINTSYSFLIPHKYWASSVCHTVLWALEKLRTPWSRKRKSPCRWSLHSCSTKAVYQQLYMIYHLSLIVTLKLEFIFHFKIRKLSWRSDLTLWLKAWCPFYYGTLCWLCRYVVSCFSRITAWL